MQRKTFVGLRARALTALAAAMGIAVAIAPAAGKTVTWNNFTGTGVWNTTDANWVGGLLYAPGDDVIFPGRTDPGTWHYNKTYKVNVAPGGVSPNSILVTSHWTDTGVEFAGGVIGGAAKMTVDSTWVANGTFVAFDGATAHTFSGGIDVLDGNWLESKPAAPGPVTLGTGPITLINSRKLVFSPTVLGVSLTTPITTSAGEGQIIWENRPTFAGDLTLGAGVFFTHPGGGNRTLDVTGDVVLTGDRTIRGGVRDVNPPLVFAGQFLGAAHTLTLDFNHSQFDQHRVMQTTHAGPWQIGNLILQNGQTDFSRWNVNLRVDETNATHDYFASLRANGGKVDIRDATLSVHRGGINFADLQSTTGEGRVLFDMRTTSPEVHLLGAGMVLTSDSNGIPLAAVLQTTNAKGLIHGPIAISNGGTLRLQGQYGKAIRHADGDLTLLGGSTLYARWGLGAVPSVSLSYTLEGSSQKIILGDGDANTIETITLLGHDSATPGNDRLAAFFLGADPDKIVDDGGVVLRYVSEAGKGVFNVAWAPFDTLKNFSYATNRDTLAFRNGSAGNEFAPGGTTTDTIGVIGPDSGTVMTITSPTRLTTTGKVGFHNNLGGGHGVGHRGPLGELIVDAGGSFDLVAAGIVQAASIVVRNGGSIGGIGTFDADVTLEDGVVDPGASIGTLTVIGSLTFGPTTELNFDLAAAGLCDLIAVTGDLTVDGLLNVVDYGGMEAGLYTLMTYTGSLVDNDMDLVMPEDWLGQLSTTTPHRIDLIVDVAPTDSLIPEPATALLVTLGLAGMIRRRRR